MSDLTTIFFDEKYNPRLCETCNTKSYMFRQIRVSKDDNLLNTRKYITCNDCFTKFITLNPDLKSQAGFITVEYYNYFMEDLEEKLLKFGFKIYDDSKDYPNGVRYDMVRNARRENIILLELGWSSECSCCEQFRYDDIVSIKVYDRIVSDTTFITNYRVCSFCLKLLIFVNPFFEDVQERVDKHVTYNRKIKNTQFNDYEVKQLRKFFKGE